MSIRYACSVFSVTLLFGSGATMSVAAPPPVDDTPGGPEEWGFRPADGSTSQVNPPGFVWRPQKEATGYTIQCARTPGFDTTEYEAAKIEMFCHCPPKQLAPGKWYWRFRYVTKSGVSSAWSKTRSFTISVAAIPFPMPPRDQLLARIPARHPRLFIRPEDLPRLRELAKTDLKPAYDQLLRQCDTLLKKPPVTNEPPTYPKGTARLSEEWRTIWWGNRQKTEAVLGNAATLAFTRLLGGNPEYGQLAKRLLLAAAAWDPKGATGYRYNDEAGMPYAYYFSRTYTFVNDLLTDSQKEACRRVMRVRGNEMYRHLYPRHLWQPYASHSNRAWHYLGEVGIAFKDEIPEASDWVWFAINVFYNVYPVWCDDDGGWHEGVAYWNSYVTRFTWWADVMRAAMGIDAYAKPYFAKVGYYPMYLQPPGTKTGGFGDLTSTRTSSSNRSLMTTLAAQAHNGYWQWYVDALGGSQEPGGYIGFVRGVLPKVTPKPPTDLPSSRCFHGIGQAMLNSNLLDGRQNVQIVFKSSPFGLQSHGYESNNSFILNGFGERLLVRSGERDIHGSAHHRLWMHSTRSTNNITVNGVGQIAHAGKTRGRITAFHTSDAFDYVAGDALRSYGKALDKYERHILFVKPDLIVIFDRLEAPKPSTFEWWLHAMNEPAVTSQTDVRIHNGPACCRVSLLAPQDLRITQTNQFDPPPRPRLKLVQWHLTATTAETARRCEFVTLIRVHRQAETSPSGASIEKTPYGYQLRANLHNGYTLVALKSQDDAQADFHGTRLSGAVAAIRFNRNGEPAAYFVAPE